jgi:opacity protein-like surface antigen
MLRLIVINFYLRMNIMKKVLLSFVLATSALSALAQDSSDFYVQANAGYAFGMKSNFKGVDSYEGDVVHTNSAKISSGNSGSFGLEVGYKLHENFRASLGVDYLPGFSIKTNNSKLVDSENEQWYSKSSKVKSLNLMANLFVDAGEFNGFKPYLVVGLGMASNKTASVTSIDNKNNLLKGKTKTNFAWKIGLGTRYALNEQLDLDLRYQYIDLGKASWNSGGADPKQVTSANDYKLKANQITLGVAYKF